MSECASLQVFEVEGDADRFMQSEDAPVRVTTLKSPPHHVPFIHTCHMPDRAAKYLRLYETMLHSIAHATA